MYNIRQKKVCWCILFCILGVLSLGFGPTARGAGDPMVIDYSGTLSNGLKTEAKGTIHSVADLSNGNFKTKVITKSEQDPTEVNKFLLNGPIQIGDNSGMTSLQGTIKSQSTKKFVYDVATKEQPLPKIHISNVATTKSGQNLDIILTITNIKNPQENAYLQLSASSDKSIDIAMRYVAGVSYSCQFVTSDTQQPYDVLSFIIINDIDYSQCFEMNGTALGHGSNLTQTSDTRFEATPDGYDGLNDFPMGGILYQYFGNKINATYDCHRDGSIDNRHNGAYLFGASGTIQDVEITKPDFGEVIIPKANWSINSDAYEPGKTVFAQFQQPINALDVNINHRYANWDTLFTIPSEIENPTITMLSNKEEAIPITTTQVNDTQYQVAISAETMKQLSFSGETYTFEISGNLTDQLVDGSVLSFQAETNLDGKTDTLSELTTPIDHKITVKAKYLRQESTDSVAKSKKYTFGYGKSWNIPPIEAPEGYYYDTESTTDSLSGENVDFQDKTVTCYYAPLEKNIYVNYLDETGNKITGSVLKANYQEAYTTTANDIEDTYSLLTDRIPENASGIVGNTDITVDYFYRETRGSWVDLGGGIRSITRMDYLGHIRSTAINYADGELITLLNEANGLMVYQDSHQEGAISEKSVQSGNQYLLSISKQDKVIVDVYGIGSFKLTRQNSTYKSVTTVTKGIVTQDCQYFSGKQVIEENNYLANGVSGTLLSQKNRQWINGQYQIISERMAKENPTVTDTTTAVDAPATDYATQVQLPAETIEEMAITQTKKQPIVSFMKYRVTDKAKVSVLADEAGVDSDEEDTPAVNNVTFTSSLTGSAAMPVVEDQAFTQEAATGDTDNQKEVVKQLSDNYRVKVYDQDKLLAEKTIPEGEQLDVSLPVSDNDKQQNESSPADTGILNNEIQLAISPTDNRSTVGQQMADGQVAPVENGQFPKTGENSSRYWVLGGSILVLVILFIFTYQIFSKRKDF